MDQPARTALHAGQPPRAPVLHAATRRSRPRTSHGADARHAAACSTAPTARRPTGTSTACSAARSRPTTAAGADGPPGVALHVPGNAVLLMNTHYLNATPAAARHRPRTITLYTLIAAEVTHEAGVLFFYNFSIARAAARPRPRRACAARSRATSRCSTRSRTCTRAASATRPTSLRRRRRRVEPLYTNDSWENVPVTLVRARPAAAGRQLHRLPLRATSNDEPRIVLPGADHPRRDVHVHRRLLPARSRSSSTARSTTTSTPATWPRPTSGAGTARCGDSLDCFANARSDDNADWFTACIDASCPAAGRRRCRPPSSCRGVPRRRRLRRGLRPRRAPTPAPPASSSAAPRRSPPAARPPAIATSSQAS